MTQTRDLFAPGTHVTIRRHDDTDMWGEVIFTDVHGVCVLRTFSEGETARILVPWTEVREIAA